MAEQNNKTNLAELTSATSGEETGSCWSCGAMRAAHFCDACGKVQPPAPVDYFAFFGLPHKLNIDVPQLERDFYKLSRRLHPDTFAQAPGEEQKWSLEKSSQLNDAYRTLRDPITRTEYLLKREGVKLEEQSKAATDAARVSGGEKKQMVPPDLLEEVFELNLQLEEARMNKKTGAADPEVLEELRASKAHLESKLAAIDTQLREAWSQWDSEVDGGNEPAKIAARDRMLDVLNRRSYIRNLVRDVNEVIE